ncbi:MAG: agmatinase [Candidatus Pacebacteria bacterium]|nr:agmatinase [Candidatus Paceibacterota bacterium]
MVKTIINSNTKDAEVVFVSAPYEQTASSHKGTVAGPSAVIEQLNHQIEFFDRKSKKNVTDFVKIGHEDLGEDLNKLSPVENAFKIENACQELIKKDKFVFMLGGEHAVSVGHLRALSKKYNPKDVTILHIDAHCDLRNDDSDYNDEEPSDLAHSTVMRRASELGFPLVQVGIRTYSEDEYKYFSNKKNNVTVFEWGTGFKIPSISKIVSSIKTKYLFISVDVDGFDPAHMPGTGTVVQGGLEWWYGVSLLEQAIAKKELVGADIVEVSPLPDSQLTEYGAAQLAYTIIGAKFAKRLK